jgi:hypothetical protein
MKLSGFKPLHEGIHFLPSSKNDYREHEKIYTYHVLSSIGCPVLKSVLIGNNDLSPENITNIKDYLGSEFCTIRYEYIKPNSSPARGGNLVKLKYEDIVSKKVPDTILWLLEPVNRTTNCYGINLFVNRNNDALLLECVGKGFDVSSLNRGESNPHQTILFRLPIEYGWNNEWWKYAKFYFISQSDYNDSKHIRIQKLRSLGMDIDESFFNSSYEPLPFSHLEMLLKYSEKLYNIMLDEKEFVVSCSILENQKIIFWDMTTPSRKLRY